MTDELRSEIVMPRKRPSRRAIGIGIGCGVLGSVVAFVGAMTWMSERSSNVVAVIAPPDEVVPVPIETPKPVVIEPLVVPAPEVSLVFSAGGDTYVQLTASELPLHGKPRLLTEDGIQIAIARVATKHLPMAQRVWKDRKVKVDNTCEAKVTGFAVVARVTGMRDMTDTGDEEWTAETVLENGSPMLAARLDTCIGSYARASALPDIIVLEDTEAPSEELVEHARAIVLASPNAVEAQRAWKDDGEDGNWYDDAETRIATRVVRNPVFGTTLVSVHVYRFGDCGLPGGNIWGLFLVDRDGKLATLQLHAIGMPHIDQIIDLEGDGEVELLGVSRLDTTIERANGDDVDSLTVAETGCGC